MAFMIHSVEGGYVPPWQYLPAAAGTYNPGDALYIASGKVSLVTSSAGNTNATEHYVCMGSGTLAAGDKLPCIRANREITFEAPLSAASASIAVGAAYTLAGNESVTATTTDGVFVVTDWDGTASGSLIRGRFSA